MNFRTVTQFSNHWCKSIKISFHTVLLCSVRNKATDTPSQMNDLHRKRIAPDCKLYYFKLQNKIHKMQYKITYNNLTKHVKPNYCGMKQEIK